MRLKHNLENCWEGKSGIQRRGVFFYSLIMKKTTLHHHCLYSQHEESATHHVKTLGLFLSFARKSQREQSSWYFFLITLSFFLFLAGSQNDSKSQSKVHVMEEDPFPTSLTDKAEKNFQGFSSLGWIPKW